MTCKTHRPVLTSQECALIAWVFEKVVEYLGGDDRPDHGLAKLDTLKRHFEGKFGEPDELKDLLYRILVKMGRLR
jgi:hypothetical protein